MATRTPIVIARSGGRRRSRSSAARRGAVEERRALVGPHALSGTHGSLLARRQPSTCSARSLSGAMDAACHPTSKARSSASRDGRHREQDRERAVVDDRREGFGIRSVQSPDDQDDGSGHHALEDLGKRDQVIVTSRRQGGEVRPHVLDGGRVAALDALRQRRAVGVDDVDRVAVVHQPGDDGHRDRDRRPRTRRRLRWPSSRRRSSAARLGRG